LGLPHGYDSSELSEKELKLWTQATVAIHKEPQTYLASNKHLTLPDDHLKMRSDNLQTTTIYKRVIRESPAKLDDDPYFWSMMIAFPMVYGSVHLVAWNFVFPTYTEKMMWRVACTFIAGGIPLSLILFVTLGLGYEMGEWLFGKDPWKRFIERTQIIWTCIFYAGFISLLALYLSARLFIIIELFMSIRRLPLGVFLTVNWSTYIPHL
jgi:hypothetical protein